MVFSGEQPLRWHWALLRVLWRELCIIVRKLTSDLASLTHGRFVLFVMEKNSSFNGTALHNVKASSARSRRRRTGKRATALLSSRLPVPNAPISLPPAPRFPVLASPRTAAPFANSPPPPLPSMNRDRAHATRERRTSPPVEERKGKSKMAIFKRTICRPRENGGGRKAS